MHNKVKNVLLANETAYKEIRHDSFKVAIHSPFDFAKVLGIEIERITKTVFLRAKTKDKYIMAICSCNQKLDLQKLAVLAQVTKLELADKQELETMIGYPPTGVSAIAVPQNILVYMDEGLLNYATILTGAGMVAVEIELKPKDLATLAKATLAQLILL